MKRIIFALLLSLCAWAGPMDDANRAYQQGHWQEAAAGYQALLANGADSAALHYNLANAYVQLGDYGRARLGYERALLFAPRDPDVRANLALLSEKLVEPAQSPQAMVSRNELVVVVSALWFLSALLGAGWLKRRSPAWAWMASLSFLGSVSLGALVAFIPTSRAIVIPSEVQVFQGPGRELPVLDFTLHAGTPVQIRRAEGAWREIQAPGHPRGWVRAEQIEAVSLS